MLNLIKQKKGKSKKERDREREQQQQQSRMSTEGQQEHERSGHVLTSIVEGGALLCSVTQTHSTNQQIDSS